VLTDNGAAYIAVVTVEAGGPDEEASGGCCFLVGEHFGVGEAAVVVNGDVDVLPAFLALVAPVVAAAGYSVSRAVDPAELLDVEMDELARS
jgi:hypothetical protein